jgi:ribonuclease P protein component
MTKPRASKLEASVVSSQKNARNTVQNGAVTAQETPSGTVFKKLPFSSLTTDRAFQRVRNKGKPGRTALLTLRWIPQRKQEVNIGIVVSRKVGKAVIRNRIRRRLREAARRMDWPAMQAMIVVTPEAATASYADLVKALRVAAAKSGLR